ncbi:MAG: nuclear transport factor 2 family protein [Pseudomonadales bacterium]|nr:nuclear transport factor 2 family protein [Pseudomonadales bacterium]
MADNERIIRDFIAAWSRMDASELAGYFTEEGCYYNMPTQPVKGRANVEAFIAGFTSNWTETTWELRNIAAVGDIVYTERLDRTRTKVGNVDLPCFGVFEMQDGKIREWRDYFDLGTFMNAMKG